MQDYIIDWKAIGSMLSPVVAIVALIANYLLSSKQISKTVLANERKEWAAALRQDVAGYVSSILELIENHKYNENRKTDESYLRYRKTSNEIVLFIARTQILLNPNEITQKELFNKIENTYSLLVSSKFSPNELKNVSKYVQDIISLTQKVISNELSSNKMIRR